MMRQARQKIVVADHRKIGATGTALICPIESVDILITDRGAPDEAVAPFVAKGIVVRRV
jgi:DeoR family transcriptional regulator of aga operon